MQPIQPASCPDRHRSSAAYLAAMIDKRTRDYGLPASSHGGNPWRFETGMQQPDASVLIRVGGDPELAREAAAGRHRGMIVVAHGSGQGTTEGSFIISYPVATDEHAQHLPAVSGWLEAMGWSVLASRRRRTDIGDVNTAVLVNTGHSSPEQRLWLAEPVSTAYDRSPPAHALVPGPSPALGRGNVRTREFRNQLEAWVNEGGAGDDVAS